MTFKDIAKQLTTAVQTVPNIVEILRNGFEQATTGGTVEVTQVVSSGTKIASIKVDDETTDLYASVAYVAAETKIGSFLGNDLYRQVIPLTNITVSSEQNVEVASLATGLKPRKMIACAYENGKWYQSPEYALRIFYVSNTGKLNISAINSNWAFSEGYIIFEYEKP